MSFVGDRFERPAAGSWRVMWWELGTYLARAVGVIVILAVLPAIFLMANGDSTE